MLIFSLKIEHNDEKLFNSNLNNWNLPKFGIIFRPRTLKREPTQTHHNLTDCFNCN